MNQIKYNYKQYQNIFLSLPTVLKLKTACVFEYVKPSLEYKTILL